MAAKLKQSSIDLIEIKRRAEMSRPPHIDKAKWESLYREAYLAFSMNNQAAIEKFLTQIKSNKNQTIEAKKEISRRRSESLRDFYTFVQTYFSHYFKTPFGLQQLGLIKDIQSFQGKQFRSPIKMARALSRGFGKSTILSLCGVLWMVLRKDWKFVIMVSASLSQAKGFLQKIVDECEDNELLLNDFPELRPAKDQKGQNVAWNDNDIVFRGNARIIAKGFLNSIRGTRYKQYRPDVLIVDDPDEEKDVESESRMARKYRWFDRAALKLGSQWGIDVIVAYTTIHPRCLGEQIHKDKKKYWDWDTKKFSAIAVNESGEEYSTWEDGAPLSVLQKEREVDPVTFARERQNVILAEADQKFKGLIQTYNYADLKRRYPTFDNWTLMLGVDLSLGKNESSDLSAIVGVGQPPDDATLYVLYSSICRRTPDVIEADLLTALTMLNWNLCGIDSSGNQEYFLLGMRKVITEYNKTARKKITTPLREMDNPGDKVARVTSNLQARVASGIIKLRDDDKILYDQMEEYPHGYRDGMDGLEYAVRLHDRGIIQVVTTEQYQKIDAAHGNRSETLEDIRDKRTKKLGFDPFAGLI